MPSGTFGLLCLYISGCVCVCSNTSVGRGGLRVKDLGYIDTSKPVYLLYKSDSSTSSGKSYGTNNLIYSTLHNTNRGN